MIGKLAVTVTSVALVFSLAPKLTLVTLIDVSLSVFNWIDGVENFNTRTPNYVDGNWQPIHNELDRVPVQGKGELPKNLVGGIYVRSGANPKCWPPGDRMMNHAFNGESMLHM